MQRLTMRDEGAIILRVETAGLLDAGVVPYSYSYEDEPRRYEYSYGTSTRTRFGRTETYRTEFIKDSREQADWRSRRGSLLLMEQCMFYLADEPAGAIFKDARSWSTITMRSPDYAIT